MSRTFFNFISFGARDFEAVIKGIESKRFCRFCLARKGQSQGLERPDSLKKG